MVITFLASFFSFVHISMGGELYISELLLAAYLIFLIDRFQFLSLPLPRMIMQLCLLWLLSQIITDLIRDTPPENFLRGWAAIIFFLIDFVVIFLVVDNNVKRAMILVLGYALGLMFQFVVAPTELGEYEPWKWALAMPVTLLLLLYFGEGKTKAGYILLVMVLLGLVDVYFNARSMGGVTIVAGLIIYLSRQAGFRAMFMRRLNMSKKILLLVIGSGAVGLLLTTYQWAAEGGYLPEDVTRKYEMSKSASLGISGLVLGGRIEYVASIPAVIDSPLIGHGSWAEDRSYKLLLLEANKIFGTDRDEAQLEAGVNQSDLIPAHSHIMQAWVWAGLLGAIFWLAVLNFIFKALFSVMRYPNVLQPIAVFFCISAIWDIFFSPFGSTMRLMWAIKLSVIWVAMVAAENASRSEVAKQ